MVKLLGIIGSPRRDGNTEIIVKEVLKTGEHNGAETEIIHLTDFDLKPCNGCKTCFDTHACVIKDDVEKIFKKIVESDGIVIGSPVYFYNVTAQTKTFIDRVGYLHSARGRVAFKNKVGGAITVAGRSGVTTAISQILLFFNSTRMIIATPTVAAFGYPKGEVIKDNQGIKNAQELGRTMVRIGRKTASLREPRSQHENASSKIKIN